MLVVSRGMRIVFHAEGAECAEARIVSLACGLRGACFSPTDDTDVHESLLSTDDTDDTVFVTVPSQVQRATICFICGISVLSVDKKESCHSWAIH